MGSKGLLYAFGCYGTGNLGDDAIFEGLLDQYLPQYEVVQVYVRQPTYRHSIGELELIANGFASDAKRLVIGGGGLFYDDHICDRAGVIADRAIEQGVTVTVERIGLETVPRECYHRVSELFSKCERFTVRSSESQAIARKMGFEPQVFDDFAFRMIPEMDGAQAIMPMYEDSLPIIGLATAGGIANFQEPVAIAKALLNHFNVLHLPHVRHLIDNLANEVAKGEIIYSSLGDLAPELFKRYKCLPYPGSPRVMLGVYSLLQGVVSYRYHSSVFSEMAGIPFYARTGGSCLKNNAYFNDHRKAFAVLDTREVPSSDRIPRDVSLFFQETMDGPGTPIRSHRVLYAV